MSVYVGSRENFSGKKVSWVEKLAEQWGEASLSGSEVRPHLWSQTQLKTILVWAEAARREGACLQNTGPLRLSLVESLDQDPSLPSCLYSVHRGNDPKSHRGDLWCPMERLSLSSDHNIYWSWLVFWEAFENSEMSMMNWVLPLHV